MRKKKTQYDVNNLKNIMPDSLGLQRTQKAILQIAKKKHSQVTTERKRMEL